jgi:hypothetical protein
MPSDHDHPASGLELGELGYEDPVSVRALFDHGF